VHIATISRSHLSHEDRHQAAGRYFPDDWS